MDEFQRFSLEGRVAIVAGGAKHGVTVNTIALRPAATSCALS